MFLAPTGELYETLCHRRGRERGRERGSKMNVFAITWIRLVWFGLNLAWTYNFTLETSPRKNFSFSSKSKMAGGGQKFQNRSNLTPQITFRLRIWNRRIRFGQYLACTYYWTLETTLWIFFSFISKSKMATGGQKSKIGQILPHTSHFGSSFGSGSSNLDQIWQVNTTQPKEQAYVRIFDLSQNPRWPPQPPLRQITKSVITWKVYNLDIYFFLDPCFQV